jgi:WD40 repeat protein
MIHHEEILRVRGDIIAIEALSDDEVIFAQRHKTIKSFSLLTSKLISNNSVEHLGGQTTAICFHKTLELVAIANGKTIYIVNTKTKIVLQTIISYSGDITLLHFVQNSPYLITGTKNGRVVQYRYDGKSSLSRLCSFPFNNPIGKKVIGKNYVGAIDSNEKYVACSGYGGAITLIKLHSLTHKQTIQSARVRVNVLKLLDDDLLLSASIDENIYFHDLKKYKSTKTITSPIGAIKKIIPIKSTSFAILVGSGNSIALLDSDTQKIVNSQFVKFDHELVSLLVTGDDTLIALLQNNTIQKVKLPGETKLDQLIGTNKLQEAYQLIQSNPLLQSSSKYDDLEELYNKLYKNGFNAFIAGNKKEAMKILEPFKNLKNKKDEISLLLNSFDQFKKFHTLVVEKKYHIAYSYCEKYPALEHTHPFTRIEEEFDRSFTFALKQIKIGREDLAKEALLLYKTVKSKKEIVQLLLKNSKEFLIFIQSLKKNNYKNIAILINKDENYKKLPQYIAFEQNLQKTLKAIENDIYNAQIDQAIKKIKTIQYLPNINERLKELYELANYTKLFLEAYKANDFNSCYEIIDKSKEIERLKLAILLEQHWSKLINRCENLAFKGDLKGIKEVLGGFITLKSRRSKIGDLIRLSFHTKVKLLFAKRAYGKAESIIYSYLDIFGLDTEIKALMRTYEKLSNSKLALTNAEELYKDRDGWVKSQLIVGEFQQ